MLAPRSGVQSALIRRNFYGVGVKRLRGVVGVLVPVLLAVAAVGVGADVERGADASIAGSERLSADDPYTLAVDIARQIAGGSLATLTDLIITTGEQPTDAIVSAGLAAYLDTCPRPDGRACNRTATLLTQASTLPEATAEAITASGVPAERITLIGGTDAVSDDVHRQIATVAGWNGAGANPATRVAGPTRYDTAAAIATHLVTLSQQPGGLALPTSYRTIVVANGTDPADALAASTLAYRNGHLLLLSPTTTPSTALDTVIDTLDANCALVIGGTNALSTQVSSTLAEALATTGTGTCAPQRIAGTDRHHTATLIATRLTDTHGAPASALLTNSDTPPLPLTAAPLTRSNTTLLTTRTNQLPDTTRTWLDQHPTINRITIIGAESAVSPGVAARALDTTITAPAGGGGAGGGGFSLSYASTAFLTSSTSQTLAPTVTGGTGPYTYAITNGSLPSGVTFDTTTGAFTGPATWNLGFTTISVGRLYSCGILTDTTARCWGNTANGEGGDGIGSVGFYPTAVLASGTQASNPVTLSGITQLSAGLTHTCALLADTTARCFGWNSSGALGDGTTTARLNPVAVLASGTQASNPVTLSGITHITAGTYHTCALLADTTARCWGRNTRGQLADGTTTQRLNPVAVLASGTQASNPVTLSGITRIETGQPSQWDSREHTCAVMADTTMRCWGDNQQGQLGSGTTSPSRELNPVAVLASGTHASNPVTLSGVAQISVGYNYSCARMVDTTARCWGTGGSGNLGDGTATRRLNPVAVLASGTQDASPVTLSGITRIATSYQHTCAVLADTTARCWGDNSNGKLGAGTSTWAGGNPVRVLASGTEASSPVPQTGVVDIAGGEYHTCAALADGGARCWGYNFFGMLGDGTDSTTRLNPVRVLASGTEASSPVVFGGAITLASTTLTVTVTDSTAATADRVITLTSS